jgi:hypothetical protein
MTLCLLDITERHTTKAMNLKTGVVLQIAILVIMQISVANLVQ